MAVLKQGCFYVNMIKMRFFTNCQQLQQKPINSLDDSILHIDVSTEGLVIVHNLGPFDQETVTLEGSRDDD